MENAIKCKKHGIYYKDSADAWCRECYFEYLDRRDEYENKRIKETLDKS